MNNEIAHQLEGLKNIRKARKIHQKNVFYILLLCGVVAGLSTIFPPIAGIEIILFVIFWLSHVKTARISCPRCNNSFGTSAFIPLGLGTEACESCGLSMSLLTEPKPEPATSTDEEWYK